MVKRLRAMRPPLLAVAAAAALVLVVGQARAQTPELTLADFDQTGLEVDALALIEAGSSSGIIFAVAPRGTVGDLLAGELGMGSSNVPITQLQFRSSEVTFNDSVDNFTLSSYFGGTGPGNDLSVYIQTSTTTVAVIPISTNTNRAGGGYITLRVPSSTEQTIIDGIANGDDFLFALARPAPNVAPVVSASGSPLLVEGGAEVALDGTASDTAGETLTYSWEALPAVGTFANASAVDTTWTAPASTSVAQPVTLTLTATDDQSPALSGSATVTVTVRATNVAPVVSASGDPTSVEGGAEVALDGTASDSAGEALTYSWEASPDVGAFANASAVDTTWTAPASTSAAQSVTLTLTVTDDRASPLSATATVRVTVLQTQLTLADFDQTGLEVDVLALIEAGSSSGIIFAMAPRGDVGDLLAGELGMGSSNVPITQLQFRSGEVTFNDSVDNFILSSYFGGTGTGNDLSVYIQTSTATVAVIPISTNTDRAGGGYITLRVPSSTEQAIIDGIANGDEFLFALARAPNAAPVVSASGNPTTLDGGGDVTLDGTATDTPGEVLTYSWEALPAVGTFANASAVDTTWTAPASTSAAQPVTLTLTATDDQSPALSGSATVTVTVRATNVAPVVSASGDPTSVEGGAEVALDGTASDSAGEALTYSWEASPDVGAFANASAVDTTWTAPASTSAAQSVTLTLTATDDRASPLSSTATVRVTVLRGNARPVVSASGDPTSVEGGAEVALDGTASDTPGEALTYSWEASPDVGTFSNASAVDTTWTAPASTSAAQPVTLTLTATDDRASPLSSTAAVRVTVLRGNARPGVSASGDPTSVEGGAEVALDGTASDTPGETLTYSWEASPDVGTFANASAVDTTWTAPASTSAAQPVTLTLTATDDRASPLSSTAAVRVTVLRGNARPGVSASGDPTSVEGGAEVALDGTASDTAGETLTYSWEASPDVGTFANASAVDTTWTAPASTSAAQPVTLTLTATDDRASPLSSTATVRVTVLRGNARPGVSASGDPTSVEGGADVALDGTASDTAGETLTYSWEALPDVGAFANASAVDTTWTAPASTSAAQPVTLTLTATDDRASPLSATATVRVTVLRGNARPVVSASGNPTSVEGEADVALDGTASDTAGETLTYSWEALPDVGAFANASAVDTTWTAPASTSAAQPVTLTLTATDDRASPLSATATVRVTVLRGNARPVVSASGDPLLVEGEADVVLDGTASDTPGEALTYSWEASPDVGAFANASAVDTTWTAPASTSAAQPVTLTLTATDDRASPLSATATVRVTVLRGNARPVVSASGSPLLVEGEADVVLDGTASDTAGETLTYSWEASPDVGAFANASAVDTTWTAPPRTASRQPVALTLTVTDDRSPAGSSTASVSVSVRANDVPSPTASAEPATVGGGGDVVLSVEVTDRDDTTHTYSWFASPSVGTLSSATALSSTWTAPARTNSPQTVIFTVVVTDSMSASDYATVTVTVRANAEPVPRATASPRDADGRGAVALTGSVTDADDTTGHTYSWSASPDVGTFSSTTALSSTWTAPPPKLTRQPVTLTLTATDGLGASDSVDVAVVVNANKSPTASIEAASEVVSTGVLTLDGTATDPEQGDLTYSWVSSGGGTFGDTSALDTTWTAQATAKLDEEFTLTLTVTDELAAAIGKTHTVTVRRMPNAAPVASVTASAPEVYGRGTIDLEGSFTDSDDATGHTYSWVSSGGGTFVNSSALSTTWTAPPQTAVAQPVTLTLTVTDPESSSAATVDVSVRANEAPMVSAMGDPSSIRGRGVVTLTGNVTDADDATGHTYSWTSSGGGTFSSTTALSPTWTAPAKTSSQQRVTLTLTATDPLRAADTATVAVRIAANAPPSATVSADKSTVPGRAEVQLTGSVTDADDATGHTYSWSASPDVGTFSSTTALSPTWTAPPPKLTRQPVTLTLTVRDRTGDSGDADARVAIRANAAPVARASAIPAAVDGRGVLTLTGSVTDVDGPSLTYSWTSSGGGTFSSTTALSPTWTAPAPQLTEQAVALTLTGEDRLGASDSVDVAVVVNGNKSPTASIEAASEVSSTAVLTLDGTATDPEQGDLTYSWVSSGGGTFGDTSALDTTWTPPSGSDVTVMLTLTVTDELAATATQTHEVAVIENQPPGVSVAVTSSAVDGGGTVTLDGTAIEPDGDDLSYEWVATPDVGKFLAVGDLNTNWTAPAASDTPQTVSLTITVADPFGLTDTATVEITVRALAAGPSVVGVCSRSLEVRTAVLAATQTALCEDVTSSALSRVTSVDLSGRSLANLRVGDLSGMTGVTDLDLSGNALTPAGLPSRLLSDLTGLSDLDLSGNGMEALPPDFFLKVGNLDTLNLQTAGTPPKTVTLNLSLERHDGTGRVGRSVAAYERLAAGVPASYRVRVAEGAPFDMVVHWAVAGAVESESSGTVSVAAGATLSEEFVVVGSGGVVSVTLEVPSAPLTGITEILDDDAGAVRGLAFSVSAGAPQVDGTVYEAEVAVHNATDSPITGAWVPFPMQTRSLYVARVLTFTESPSQRPDNAVLCRGTCSAHSQVQFVAESHGGSDLTALLRYSSAHGTYNAAQADQTAPFTLLPPDVAADDAVYFVAPEPFRHLFLRVDGGRRSEHLWSLVWEYWDGTRYVPIPGVQDATRGFTRTGDNSISWPVLDDMARTRVGGTTGYAVRALVAAPGSGDYTAPTVTTRGYETGLWWFRLDEIGARSTVQFTLYLGGAPFPREHYLVPSQCPACDYDGYGHKEDLQVTVDGLNPRYKGRANIVMQQETSLVGEIDTGASFSGEVGGEGTVPIPIIGGVIAAQEFAQGEDAVPMAFFWVVLAFGLAVVAIAVAQSMTENILVSVVAGGLVLIAVSAPTIGIVSVWVIFAYGVIGGTVVIIGRRPSL